MTTKLIVVGLGRQGTRHVRVAGQNPEVDLVATVDPFTGGPPGVPHFDKLNQTLDAFDVDAAVVATPTRDHGTAVRELLERGIPTLAEKPLAADMEEAEELVAMAAAGRTLLAVGLVERFNPAVAVVAAMLRKGALGRVIDISFRRLGLAPAQTPNVDVIHDLAVHDLDVFTLLAGGAPTLVAANGWPAAGLTESAHLLVQSGDVAGAVQVNWRTPVRLRQFSLTTEGGYVEADYTTQKVEIIEPSEPSNFVDYAEFQSHYGSARRMQLDLKPAEPLAEELKAFIAAVQGEPAPLLARGADSLVSLRIADEATRRLVDG